MSGVHGYLVLRDLTVDSILLDGVELPDPKGVSDDRFQGGFRGYYNVPVGTHTIVGRFRGTSHEMTVVVRPGAATVKRFDMQTGWADDDAETAANYRRLATSGAMAEALRPWPLAAVYFRGSTEGVSFDSRTIGSSLLPFCGIVNVPPGTHALEIGAHRIELTVLPESFTLVAMDGTNRPTLVTGTRTLMSMSRDLSVMPFDAQASYPHRGEMPVRVFDDSDMEWLEETYAKPDSDDYVTALRWHYILDSEMAKQATYFARLGHKLATQLRQRPGLLATGAKIYLGYFAQDLVDAGDEATVAAGKDLAAAIEEAELAPAESEVEEEPSPVPPLRTDSKASPSAPIGLAVVGVLVGIAIAIFLLMRG